MSAPWLKNIESNRSRPVAEDRVERHLNTLCRLLDEFELPSDIRRLAPSPPRSTWWHYSTMPDFDVRSAEEAMIQAHLCLRMAERALTMAKESLRAWQAVPFGEHRMLAEWDGAEMDDIRGRQGLPMALFRTLYDQGFEDGGDLTGPMERRDDVIRRLLDTWPDG